MKILVTGVGGQLGYDVACEIARRGHIAVGTDILCESDLGMYKGEYVRLDATDKSAVNEAFESIRPDAVIHCAAWTAVDAAEDEENYEKVCAINVDATCYIAQECKRLDISMMYISTDYVFDGSGSEPWEPESTEFAPLNIYGKTKLDGEMAVKEILDKYFIVRIAWVFGINGGNFVKTMLNVGKKYDTLRVVNDQIGTPTYTFDLAQLLADMIVTDRYGIYHATNSGGFISWYDFACEIFKVSGYSTKVIPVSTEEYGVSKAKRPTNSKLSKNKLAENGFGELRHWTEALRDYISKLENI